MGTLMAKDFATGSIPKWFVIQVIKTGWLFQSLFMNKNTGNSHSPWNNYEGVRPSGSLIVGNYSPNYHAPLNKKPSGKLKIEQNHQKQQTLVRHSSDEEFRRFNPRPSNPLSPGEEQKQQRNYGWERYNAGNVRKTSKEEKDAILFKARNSGGRASKLLNLKETASTTSNEQLQSHKSQKALPSFLRNQARSPDRTKVGSKGLCRQSFRVIRTLGQGKFGTVSLARELCTGMIVALKVMNKRKIIQDNLLIQFIRQLKIQTFLDHPNITKTFGFFADQQYFYTILQLGCDGQLYNVITNGQRLSEESTSFIIGNLLEAVQLMHKHKILHRDIKPENIVLVHGNVKLCDFGWAVNKKEELRATFCGTPLYLSPELLQGERYDEKVDLWAVGVLAYELLFGTSPFNINQQEDLKKIVTDEVEFPTNKKVSKEFKEFISVILKKNPKERLPCKDLLNLQFIRKYQDLQSCQELCQ